MVFCLQHTRIAVILSSGSHCWSISGCVPSSEPTKTAARPRLLDRGQGWRDGASRARPWCMSPCCSFLWRSRPWHPDSRCQTAHVALSRRKCFLKWVLKAHHLFMELSLCLCKHAYMPPVVRHNGLQQWRHCTDDLPSDVTAELQRLLESSESSAPITLSYGHKDQIRELQQKHDHGSHASLLLPGVIRGCEASAVIFRTVILLYL